MRPQTKKIETHNIYEEAKKGEENFKKYIEDPRKGNVNIDVKTKYDSPLVSGRDEDFEGVTALIYASAIGDYDTVELLVKYRANIRATNSHGATSLLLASRYGHSELVEFLLDKGSNVNTHDSSKWSALMVAAHYSHEKIVQILLDRGADINAVNDDGNTALIYSQKSVDCNDKILKLLLERGAEINISNKKGETALMKAAESGCKKNVEILLDHGSEKKYALISAASHDHIEIVKLLLDLGVDINARDNKDRTALMCASRSGNKETVEFLLDKGAEINVINNEGYSALLYAAENSHPILHREKVIELLLERGADPNISIKGLTPLMMVSRFNINIVKLLLDHGADINAVDDKGNTAMEIAYVYHNKNRVDFLFKPKTNTNSKSNFKKEKGSDAKCSEPFSSYAHMDYSEIDDIFVFKEKDNVFHCYTLEELKWIYEHRNTIDAYGNNPRLDPVVPNRYKFFTEIDFEYMSNIIEEE
jgi:ankyrin repeat protein